MSALSNNFTVQLFLLAFHIFCLSFPLLFSLSFNYVYLLLPLYFYLFCIFFLRFLSASFILYHFLVSPLSDFLIYCARLPYFFPLPPSLCLRSLSLCVVVDKDVLSGCLTQLVAQQQQQQLSAANC